MAVLPNFSAKVEAKEADVTDLLEPLGKPLARHVTHTYGINESMFMLQSAADATLQFVGECLDSHFKTTNEDLAETALDKIYEKKVFSLGILADDADLGFDDDSTGPMELPERVKRAQMFASDKWHGAEDVPLVRDFGALFKMCLEPIGKLVENHGLDIELDTLQFKLSWNYEDALKYKSGGGDEEEAAESDADDDSDKDSILGFGGEGGGFLDDFGGKRVTKEELDSEFPLVTLQLGIGSGGEKKTLRTERWRPKGFYRQALEPNFARSGGKKDHANISWQEAVEMPGAIVIESTPENCNDAWRLASTSRGPPKDGQKYGCDIDSYIPVKFDVETTKAVWCKFDARSSTEYRYDYLEVFKTVCGGDDNRPPNDELSGKFMGLTMERMLGQGERPQPNTANFPGCREDLPNKNFPVHELELHWHTDESYCYWGWVAVFWPESGTGTPRVHSWALSAFGESKLWAKGDESWDQFLEVKLLCSLE